jgi:hypothetical protein
VRIASRLVLKQFLRDWKYHKRLQPEQLNYADQFAEIEAVGFYHGGDELYKLKGIPGVWHPQCLLPAAKSKRRVTINSDHRGHLLCARRRRSEVSGGGRRRLCDKAL